jgi:hypothetical protein
MKNTLITLFVLCVGLLVSSFSCNECDFELIDESPCTLQLNIFENHIHLGDTIRFSSILDSEFDLTLSGETYNGSNKSVGIYFKIFQILENDNHAIPARDAFEMISDPSTVLSNRADEFQVSLFSRCNEDNCDFEISLTPNSTGYYGLYFLSGSFGSGNECEYLSLDPLETNNFDTNNFDIIEELNKTRFWVDGARYEDFESRRDMYFFKVIN